MILLDIKGRSRKVYPSKYTIKWDLKRASEPQFRTKKFLKEFWFSDLVCEEFVIPTRNQIEQFTTVAKEVLSDLSFDAQKGIIRNVIEKIIAVPDKLVICGYIPITNKTNVEYFTSDRYGVNKNQYDDLIKFRYEIKLKY